MENASKALIIAGAILLAILIISLGIMVFQNAKGVVDTNAMSELEIQQFNQKFTQYEGDRVRGASVRTMIQAVLTNNVSQDDANRKIAIDGDFTLAETATSVDTTTIPTGATYKIRCTYGTSNAEKGLVNKITITKQS